MTRPWLRLLGGPTIWAAHFFTLYAIGEWSARGSGARIGVAVATAAALAATIALVVVVRRASATDPFERWWNFITVAGAGLAAIAITWQALPAIL